LQKLVQHSPHSPSAKHTLRDHFYFLHLNPSNQIQRITLKTLKVQYWSRYPIGEIKLAFDGIFLRNKITVAAIRALQKDNHPRTNKKHGQIVVLRALDEETEKHERQAVADRALMRSIRQTIGNEEAVVISDSEDEADNKQDSEGGRRDGTSNTSDSGNGSDDDEQVVEVDANTPYRGLGAYTSANANLGPSMAEGKSSSQQSDAEHVDDHMDEAEANNSDEDQGMDEDGGDDGNLAAQLQHFIHDDHSPEDYQLLMDADQLDPASYQLMVESGQLQYNQSSNTNEAAQMLVDFSNDQQVQASDVGDTSTTPSSVIPVQGFAQSMPTFVVFEQLQPVQQQALNFSDWYNCASPYCQRQMVLKPWTRYHSISVEPLCTECTRVFLRDPVLNTDRGALDHLEKQALVHWNEKARRQNEGKLQNMADDAPFDHSAVMRGPVAFTSHVNVDTDMPIVDGDAISPVASQPESVNNNDIMSQLANYTSNEDHTVSSPLAKTSHNLDEDDMSQLVHNRKNTNDSTSDSATILDNSGLWRFAPTRTTPPPPEEPKQSTWSTMFSGIKNAFTRSPPKSKSATSSNEGRSSLQSPAHTTPVNGASDMLNPTAVNMAANDNRRTTSHHSGNSDFDTNIDDLIDEDSFAADPSRVVRHVEDQLVEDADNESESEGGYEEEEEEEDEESKHESDEAEYHAAVVEKVKVYDDEDDESDGEYLDD